MYGRGIRVKHSLLDIIKKKAEEFKSLGIKRIDQPSFIKACMRDSPAYYNSYCGALQYAEALGIIRREKEGNTYFILL